MESFGAPPGERLVIMSEHSGDELFIDPTFPGMQGPNRATCASARPLALVEWPVRVHWHIILHSRHRGAAADPGPLIGRTLLDMPVVKSSILERKVLRIGDLLAL